MIRSAMIFLVLGFATPVRAEVLPPPAEGQSYWGFGATGIHCYQQPCLWHGIFPVARDGTRGTPLAQANGSGPPLEASMSDRVQISEALAEGGCIIAEGRLEENILTISRILGACRDVLGPWP